jgi:hypothetical protein
VYYRTATVRELGGKLKHASAFSFLLDIGSSLFRLIMSFKDMEERSKH